MKVFSFTFWIVQPQLNKAYQDLFYSVPDLGSTEHRETDETPNLKFFTVFHKSDFTPVCFAIVGV